jgi:hypothetical protein
LTHRIKRHGCFGPSAQKRCLREQRHRTLTLIDVSTGTGHTRVAEMNRQVVTTWTA